MTKHTASGLVPIYLSSEELAVHASNKVLLEVDDTRALTVGNPQGI
jgi:hypothetical protein